MKLKLTKISELKEIEIEIKYPQMNQEVNQIIKRLETISHYISGNDNGRQYKVKVEDIYYIESVDKKTFIYGKEKVFRSELKLYQLQDELKDYDFIQISKSCILNLNVLESIQNLVNSRIEATLSNGEKLNVSRTFIPIVKDALRGERG